MMRSNDVRVTKKVIEQKGALYDATIYKASIAKEESYFPLKLGDERLRNVTKYGGYTSIKIAYYTIVSYDEIGGKKRESFVRIVPIPIYVSESAHKFDEIENYAYNYVINKSKKSIENFKLIYKRRYLNSVIELNGFKYYVGGKTNEKIYIDSAIDLILDKDNTKCLTKIVKFYKSDFKKMDEEYVNFDNNMKLFDYLVSKKSTLYYINKKSNKLDEFRKENTLNKFRELLLEDQCIVLLEILNTLTDKKTTYDLKKIDISVSRSTVGMKLNENMRLKVINQSITGLFENVIDILG